MYYWNKLTIAFPAIIHNNPKYQNIINHIELCPNNKLLYCPLGFPLDLFIDETLKTIFDIQTPAIHRTEHTWNKSVIYRENQNFFEIDLLHPDSTQDISCISEFVLHIIKTKNINHMQKHFIIIKHIDHLASFFDFRILLERYQHNVIFMCTTHSISKIEAPIKSRFTTFRIPLFTNPEIQTIFKDHLNTQLNQYLIDTQTRNIIKAIFIAEIEHQEANQSLPSIITKEFCTYNFPPLYEFIKSFDKSKDNLENIRNLAYKCCQYNISILHLVEDFIKIIDDDNLHFLKIKYTSRITKKQFPSIKNNLKLDIINTGANIDNILTQSNKSREPLYIECFLCKLLL